LLVYGQSIMTEQKGFDGKDRFSCVWQPGKDDIAYVQGVLQDVSLNVYPAVDMDKVFAVGFSNGGMFVCDLVIDLSHPCPFTAACSFMGGMEIEGVTSLGLEMEDLESRLQLLLKKKNAEDEGIYEEKEEEENTKDKRKIPMYIITGQHEDNRTPSYRAWCAFHALGFPLLRFEDLKEKPHAYLSTSTSPIWAFFSKVAC